MDQPIPPAGNTPTPTVAPAVGGLQPAAIAAIERVLIREAAQELRQVLFHVAAYNDLAPSIHRQRLEADGVRRELRALELAMLTGRRK
jgi:hypothetical protein